jgi:hypothetical protein
MTDLSREELSIRGVPIATLQMMQEYAYAVPEDKVSPAAITRFIAGMDVSPAELYAALDEAEAVVGEDDTGREIITHLRSRLQAEFPDEIPSG